MQVKRNGQWLSADLGEDSVMMSVESGNYLTLSPVGARIWELIEIPTTVSALLARLADEFDVAPDVCETEVGAFLTELEKGRAVTLASMPLERTDETDAC